MWWPFKKEYPSARSWACMWMYRIVAIYTKIWGMCKEEAPLFWIAVDRALYITKWVSCEYNMCLELRVPWLLALGLEQVTGGHTICTRRIHEEAFYCLRARYIYMLYTIYYCKFSVCEVILKCLLRMMWETALKIDYDSFCPSKKKLAGHIGMYENIFNVSKLLYVF